jgi:Arm domain-containing DNA-binding protein
MASTRKNSPVRITNSFVERAELPAQGQLIYRDQALKGFGLRVTSGGVKVFILEKRINRRVRRIKIGRYPELTAEQARKQAQI